MIDAGEIIKACRHMSGMSQLELADKADVSSSSIANYEVGNTTPNVLIFEKLIEACGYEMEVFPKMKRCRNEWL